MQREQRCAPQSAVLRKGRPRSPPRRPLRAGARSRPARRRRERARRRRRHGDLDRHDRVGSVGNDSSRRDRHRLAHGERDARGPSGGDAVDDVQRAGRVGGADGEPVHGRAREGRQVDGGDARRRRAPGRPRLSSCTGSRVERPHALEDACNASSTDRSARTVQRYLAAAYRDGVRSRRDLGRDPGTRRGAQRRAAAGRAPGRARQRAASGRRSTSTTGRPTARSARCPSCTTGRPHVRVVRLRRAFGKAAALDAGFREADGDVVVTIDGDLQDDPAEIPRLARQARRGLRPRVGVEEAPARPARAPCALTLFNAVTSAVSGLRLHDMNCGLKAYRAEVVHDLRLYGELHRFVPVLAHYRGFRVTELPGVPPAASTRPLPLRPRALRPRLPRPAHRHLHGPLPPPAAPSLRRARPAAHARGHGRARLPDGRSRPAARRSGIVRC